MKKGRVTIIGGGRVGINAAFTMILRETVSELVLYDRDVERMRAEQLEFSHGLAFLGKTEVIVANKSEETKDSQIIIYTVGKAQAPGQSRLDLVKENTQLLENTLPEIVNFSPGAKVLIVSNPVDILTFKANQLLNLPKGSVFGSGTSLDTARFRFHLSEIIKINVKNIHAYILGEHGDSSFPAIANADIGGQSLIDFPGLGKEKINQAYLKTRDAAQKIISAKGATYYAIGVVINQLVKAVIKDEKRVYPVSVVLSGEYGLSNVALSVPCVLGENGVEKILEINLSNEEKNRLLYSAEVLKSFLN